jgi:hypothetical protein
MLLFFIKKTHILTYKIYMTIMVRKGEFTNFSLFSKTLQIEIQKFKKCKNSKNQKIKKTKKQKYKKSKKQKNKNTKNQKIKKTKNQKFKKCNKLIL